MAARGKDIQKEEADKDFREATEFMGTTLFRWKPDYEKAASLFEAAARKYQKMGDVSLMDCTQAYKGAAEAHAQLNRCVKRIYLIAMFVWFDLS